MVEEERKHPYHQLEGEGWDEGEAQLQGGE